MSVIDSLLARCRHFLRGIFRRDDVERELREELDGYLGMLVEQNLARGMPPRAALRAARLQFGDVDCVTEQVRDVRSGAWIEGLLRDIRYALRGLTRAPAFSVGAVATMAVGIGGGTAMFSIVAAVLLNPFDFAAPERLVQVVAESRRTGEVTNWVSYPNYRDLAESSASFDSLAAYRHGLFNLHGDGLPETLVGLMVSPGFFETLGVPPSVGRVFGRDVRTADEAVAVLSHDLWSRRFASDPAVVGRAVTIDNAPRVIVGVMPAGFNFPVGAPGASMLPDAQMQLWVPAATSAAREPRGDTNWWMFGRLKSGVRARQADAELVSIAERLEEQFPRANRGLGFEVVPLGDFVLAQVRPVMLLLLAGSLVLLLVACVNVTHLFLARAVSRESEAGLRVALGARRWQVVLQFLVESVTLTVAGGAVGMLFARYGVELLKAFGPASIPRLDQASLDWRVLLFSCAVALLTGLLVGAVPAFQVSRRDASLAFSGARATATRHRNLVHNALIGSEIALAVVLLVTAGLLVRSVLALHRVDPGFDPRGVVTGWIMPPGQKYPDAPAQQQFYTRAAANVAAVPDVACAGLVSALPFSGIANDTELRIQSPSGRTSDFRPHAELRVATPGYFCAIGLSMVAGRGFTQRDVLDAPLVALINEEAARRLWPDENPVGRRLSIDRTGEGEVWREIVGVVRSVRHRTLQTTPEPELYLPHTQYSSPIMVAVARTVADPGRAAAPLRAAVADVDADQAVFNVRTMEDLVSSSIAQNRFQALLLAFFGTAALLLSGLGIHGVVSYLLVQRRREFAIRLALGDTPVGLLAHVLRRTLVVAALGSAVGVGLALTVSHAISSLLFGVSPVDAVSFVAACAVVVALALTASLLPAREASRVSAASALRAD